jgi:hypothetical protein
MPFWVIRFLISYKKRKMPGFLLLALVTLLYAGYNLFVKVSIDHVPDGVTSAVLATICLQFAALLLSTIFAVYLLRQGNQVLQLNTPAYAWAVAAGLYGSIVDLLSRPCFAGKYSLYRQKSMFTLLQP